MRRLILGMAAIATVAMVAVPVASTPAHAAQRGNIRASGHNVQTDTGSCNNDWATVDLTKVYRLSSTQDPASYELRVTERGSFSTLAGPSPGACISGTNNGNTVAAGIPGSTIQHFDAPVSSTAEPDSTPDCAANNGCATSTDFLNAVFGAGNWTRGSFSWTATYHAGSYGHYYDTSVNWPSNNRGDITS